MMKLESVFQSIIDGNAVLITGSGAHIGVINANGKKFPSGIQLASLLYSKSGIIDPESPWDLQDASETYLEKHTKQSLIQFLKEQLRVGSVGKIQKDLYDNIWQRVYTTNYDAVPLVATSESDNKLVPVTLGEAYNRNILEDNICVYINGYIDALTENSINDEFKLTSSSYLSAQYINDSAWGVLFSEDLKTADCIVVVGLSLDYDLDIKRLIYNRNTKDKLIFIEKPDIKDDKKRKLQRLGQVYSIGVEEFTKQLLEYRKKHNASDISLNTYRSFEKYRSKSVIQPASAIDTFGFYIYGEYLKNNHIWYQKHGKYTSIVYRKEIDYALERIDNGCKVLYVHANLGNGKTIFTEMLKQALFEKRYSVFTYIEEISSKTEKEVKSIVEESDKKIVIIENYFNFMSVIKSFSMYDLSSVQFIFTARSALFDARCIDVRNILKLSPGESDILQLNKLSNSEMIFLNKVFQTNGLWGENSKLSFNDRLKILQKRAMGNCEFQSILLGVLKSEDINERFRIIIDSIKKENKKYYETIVLALLIKTMSLNLSIEDVGKILGVNIAFDSIFRNNSNVKELLEFSDDADDYKVKSSITARMILQELESNDVIIDTLVKTAKYANKYRVIEKYESLLKNIISYSHVSTYLGSNSRNRDFLITYYDTLKGLEYYNTNSFYWLQYAIACINVERYDLAQRFIDNAYSYFKVTPLSIPFQIDTAQAFLLLEKIKNYGTDSIEEDFKKAHSLLMKPTMSEKDDPAKQLVNFRYYYNPIIKEELAKAGCDEFLKKACGEAYNKLNIYLKKAKLESPNNSKYLCSIKTKLLRAAI